MTATNRPFRRIFDGIADRRRMFDLIDRHGSAAGRSPGDLGALYAGEWFEIDRAGYAYMARIQPPAWVDVDAFAFGRPVGGAVTSVYLELPIGGRWRCFHGYCDLADPASTKRLRAAILETCEAAATPPPVRRSA